MLDKESIFDLGQDRLTASVRVSEIGNPDFFTYPLSAI
jgi:hypothetical protein